VSSQSRFLCFEENDGVIYLFVVKVVKAMYMSEIEYGGVN